VKNTTMIEHKAKSVSEVVSFLHTASLVVPEVAIVLGSGVNALENLEEQKTFSFLDVFGVAPSVVGHSGSVTIGKVNGKLVAVMRGRFHLYEGHDWETVTLPTRAMLEWGVPKIIFTNAAGGINTEFRVGDLMLLTAFRDNLSPKLRETGLLPALTQNAEECKTPLTAKLAKIGDELEATGKSRPLRKGTYAGLLGPTYETIAEIHMLRKLGSDAVGMSTVPELLTVKGSKADAAAVSVITNVWTDDVVLEGHEEVLRAAKEASERLDLLLRTVIG